MEAATVRWSIHDIVTDLRQGLCRAGGKEEDMSQYEQGYGRTETQRDRDSASMGGSNSVATGLSFERDLWPQVMPIVRMSCVQDRKGCPGVPGADEAEPAWACSR